MLRLQRPRRRGDGNFLNLKKHILKVLMIGEADIEDIVKEELRPDDSQIDVTPLQIMTLGLKISAMVGEDSGIDYI